jgi:hypothetical protein
MADFDDSAARYEGIFSTPPQFPRSSDALLQTIVATNAVIDQPLLVEIGTTATAAARPMAVTDRKP